MCGINRGLDTNVWYKQWCRPKLVEGRTVPQGGLQGNSPKRFSKGKPEAVGRRFAFESVDRLSTNKHFLHTKGFKVSYFNAIFLFAKHVRVIKTDVKFKTNFQGSSVTEFQNQNQYFLGESLWTKMSHTLK